MFAKNSGIYARAYVHLTFSLTFFFSSSLVWNYFYSTCSMQPALSSFENQKMVMKAWSNGMLHNVKHRVLCKEAATRISIALFLLAPKDDKVEAPAELVGPKIPRLYRSFYYEDYRKLRFSSELQAGEALSLLAA